MDEPAVIAVTERLDRNAVESVVHALDSALAARPARLVLDLAKVESFDSAGMGALLEGMRRAKAVGIECKLRGLSRTMLDFFSLVSVDRLLQRSGVDAEREGPITRLGGFVEPMLHSVLAVLEMAGAVLHGVFVAPFRKKRVRFDRTVLELDQVGIGALPITLLIAFLLGLILAMQAYVQLRVWGAQLYIADMVGVSVTTEIGPLMTAIILAARSGSSNAAQLGAMVVSEEIDALKQMGLHPVRFLVVPKVLALAAAAGFLTVVFDVVAILGGALFGTLAAGLELVAYRDETQAALSVHDILIALAKSSAFGTCIGVVSCALGMRVEGGSDSVGRATTDAVVLSVFLIIVIDTLFVAVQRLVLA